MPPLFLILLQSPPSSLVRDLLVVLVALIIAQQITMQIVAPRVMSAHVGLHPLLLFAALLIGARESGVWGALFAGPIAAVLVAMLDTFFERFQQSSALYPDIRPDADEPIAAWDTKVARGEATKTPIETSAAPIEASPRDTPATARGAGISESADTAVHGDPAPRR